MVRDRLCKRQPRLFENLERGDIKRFELQTRKFENYEMQNISLWPGEQTTPKVVMPEPAAEATGAAAEPAADKLSSAARRLSQKLWNVVDGDTDVK